MMGIHVPIPGDEDLNLDHLVLDANGTLTDRGETIISTLAPLTQLRQHLEIHLLAVDTFGTARGLATQIGAEYRQISTGTDRREYLQSLGAHGCVAIGTDATTPPCSGRMGQRAGQARGGPDLSGYPRSRSPGGVERSRHPPSPHDQHGGERLDDDQPGGQRDHRQLGQQATERGVTDHASGHG